MRKNNWACFLLILAGIVIGGFIGSLFPSTWLNYGQSFGLSAPLVLDLGILSVTFGLSIKITLKYNRHCGGSRYLSVYLTDARRASGFV